MGFKTFITPWYSSHHLNAKLEINCSNFAETLQYNAHFVSGSSANLHTITHPYESNLIG